MTQTSSTKIALARDEYRCQACLHIYHRVRHIFDDFVWGYHPALAGGHHTLRRGRVDTPETIMALCSECHWKVENAKIPKIIIVALMSKIAGIDLNEKYPQYCPWSEDEWLQAKKSINS